MSTNINHTQVLFAYIYMFYLYKISTIPIALKTGSENFVSEY